MAGLSLSLMGTKLYALHIPFKGYWYIHPTQGCGWVKQPTEATLFTLEEVSKWVAMAGSNARYQYVRDTV